jgi:CCR4-NOT transcription complex subunit 1 TTP binding domain
MNQVVKKYCLRFKGTFGETIAVRERGWGFLLWSHSLLTASAAYPICNFWRKQKQRGRSSGERDCQGTSFASTADAMSSGSTSVMSNLSPVEADDIIKKAHCEDAVNAFFTKLYHGRQSAPEAITELERLRSSGDPQEQAVFDNALRALFDTYPLLHKYAEKELRITAVLFGAAIQAHLVGPTSTPVALRLVLESLRMSPGPGAGGKMFRFGLFALQLFKQRWSEWPMFCNHVVQIQHLAANHPDLVADMRAAIAEHRVEQDRLSAGANHQQQQQQQQQQQHRGIRRSHSET